MNVKHYPALEGGVFDKDSPFLALPYEMDAKQRRFLDGIRFSVEMAQLSFRRLRKTLYSITLDQRTQPHTDVTASVFLDAWAIIDSIHRLRELLAAIPNFHKRGPLYQIFTRGTARVEEFRHRIQHLRGDLVNPELANLSVWGTVTWLFVRNAELTRFESGGLSAGMEEGHIRPIPVPNSRTFHDQLDHVALHVGTDEVNLSESMRLTIRLARALENSLRIQLRGTHSIPLVDTLTLLEIELPVEQPDAGTPTA